MEKPEGKGTIGQWQVTMTMMDIPICSSQVSMKKKDRIEMIMKTQ